MGLSETFLSSFLKLQNEPLILPTKGPWFCCVYVSCMELTLVDTCAPLGRGWVVLPPNICPKGHFGAWGLDPQPISFYMTSAFAQSLREGRVIPVSPGWVLLP